MNTNAHLACLFPDIPVEVIKRARKMEGYKEALTKERMGEGSPVANKSASLKSVSITFGNRDSWKTIDEVEIAVGDVRQVNLAIRKVLPQIRYDLLVKIRKTALYKELLEAVRCPLNAAGRMSMLLESSEALNVNVKKFKKAWVKGGSNYNSLAASGWLVEKLIYFGLSIANRRFFT